MEQKAEGEQRPSKAASAAKGKEKEKRGKSKDRANLSGHMEYYEKGLQPSTFTGIVRIDDALHVLCKYDSQKDLELVPLQRLKKDYPLLLVRFLEKRMIYEADEEEAVGDEAEEQEEGDEEAPARKRSRTADSDGDKEDGDDKENGSASSSD